MLDGVIPISIGKLTKLVSLDVSYNSLEGIVYEDHFAKHSMLKYLDISYNRKLTFNVSREWIPPFQMRTIHVSSCKIVNDFPQWLQTQLNLDELVMSNANISGPLPTCGRCLLFLHAGDAYCFGELSGMADASLLGDDLDRGLEASVIQVIKGVDLEYTTTLQFVINMDVSSNKLIGEIPQEIPNLSLLVGLNLSNNHLSGGIPDKIGNVKALSSLDFSENQLTRMIPPSMAALTFLSHLNFSHNSLLCGIPTGNQLRTLTDPSIYAGNRDLCGAPLPNDCSIHKDPTTTSS